MYGYIYKTTINNPQSSWHNHYYIGQRKSTSLANDYYYGSGTKLISYMKKHSTKGLHKEILFVAQSPEELNELEIKAVGNLWSTDPLCMNSMPGGGSTAKYSHTPETRKRISETMKKRCADPAEHARLVAISRARAPYSQELRNKISKSNKEAYKNPAVRLKISIANKGRNPLANQTPEQIAARYAKAVETRRRKLLAGIPDPRKGRSWYTNGEINVLVKVCPEGFRPGRVMKLKHKGLEL